MGYGTARRTARSGAAKTASAAILLSVLAFSLGAQEKKSDDEGDNRTGRGGGGGRGGPLRYSFSWSPMSAVEGEVEELGMTGQELVLALPIWGRTLAIDAKIGMLDLNGDAFFPTSLVPVPKRLWSIELGLSYRHRFDNGWLAFITSRVKTASDRPFDSSDETNFGAAAALRVPARESDLWIFSLIYEPDEIGIAFPIPLVAYEWQMLDRLRLTLGLPLEAEWQPSRTLSFEASYRPVTKVHALGAWNPRGGRATFVAAFDWAGDDYALADREDPDEKLEMDSKKISLSFRYAVRRFGILEFGPSYDFDRSMTLGSEDADDDRIELDPCVSLRASYRLRF